MEPKTWKKCIMCADSREIIKRIPDNSIDFIFTDPPYNIGKHSTGNIPLPGRTAMNNDVADWDWIDFNPEEWAEEFIRILKPTGNLFIFTSYNQIGRWYNCLDRKFDTTNFMIWHKTNPAPKIFKAGFLNSCEMIFTCWNKKHTWNFLSQAEMHNFIESPICMSPERIKDPKHPAQKPVSILKKIIKIASKENDIIFDPFMGVASIGEAALDLNRRYIGIEIDRSYFDAADKRINAIINEQCQPTTSLSVGEPRAIDYGRSQASSLFFDIRLLFDEERPQRTEKQIGVRQSTTTSLSKLSPIIKWAGGKEKELKFILPNLPYEFNRFFEPFVGGGSVFMAIPANELYVNDLSEELIDLYRLISLQDSDFFKFARAIDSSWRNARIFFNENSFLVDLYKSYRSYGINRDQLRDEIKAFCHNKAKEIAKILPEPFDYLPNILTKELETNLLRKMYRMRDLEEKKWQLPENDLYDNIETAIKSALYMNYRALYNNKALTDSNHKLRCALFLFIRNYAYSGMFRYNDKGEFNVPYGGIAYNGKTMEKKLNYFQSAPLIGHLAKSHIYNLDFEAFLKLVEPQKDDFIFLDPPYDSEFSTYAKNEFNRDDQARLAHYLINECHAKWMLIIKHTDFIYNLYNHRGITIRQFEKEYLVSFMNRNDKKAVHLMITNY